MKLEPLGCDSSDVDNGEFPIHDCGDPAFVHTVHSGFNSLDGASDVRCCWVPGSLCARGLPTHSSQILRDAAYCCGESCLGMRGGCL